MCSSDLGSEFIATACIDFFVIAITPITTTLVVIATTFSLYYAFFLVVNYGLVIYIYIYIYIYVRESKNDYYHIQVN